MTIQPIFVCGCPRSGTTLLGSLLGANERVLAVPESQFVVDVHREHEQNDDEFDLESTARRIRRHFRFRLWELDIDREVEIDGVSSYPDLIRSLVEAYGMKRKKSDVDYWVDHTPENVDWLATLFDLFPDGKAVHVVRDGRAVASSIRRVGWKRHSIQQQASLWAVKLGAGLAAESRFGPRRVLRVQYEKLVMAPKEVVPRLCEFAGIEYDPAMIEGTGFQVPRYTKRQHRLVGRRPDVTRIDAWRDHLTPRQVEIFESLTGDLLRYLGYEPEYGASARRPMIHEKLTQKLGIPFWFTRDYLQRLWRRARA